MRSGYIVGAFGDVSQNLMVCDMVCMICIRNLVNLS